MQKQFECIAMDGGGKEHRVTIMAENQMDAATAIKEKGMFPVSIVSTAESSNKGDRIKAMRRDVAKRKMSPFDFWKAFIFIVLVGTLLIAAIVFDSKVRRQGYDYRNRYEQRVQQTVREMVREECLKNQ